MEILIKNVKSNKAKHTKANEKLKKQVKTLKNDLFAPTLSFGKFEILEKRLLTMCGFDITIQRRHLLLISNIFEVLYIEDKLL